MGSFTLAAGPAGIAVTIPSHPARVRAIVLLIALASHAALAAAVATAPSRSQPVDWRDQVLYFAMIDRFDDGDPTNNDQGAGVFDPADGAKYSGGDLAGITRRLDYIAGLGATGLWITPPVANQWWDGEARFSGYHGYWASDFSAVDAHYGTLEDYVALGRALDARGMTLVQERAFQMAGLDDLNTSNALVRRKQKVRAANATHPIRR